MPYVFWGTKLGIIKIYMHEWKKWKIYRKDKLYYRGEWDDRLFDKTLVVVGSRKMTRYGKEVVGKFMPDLIASGMTIISGFMYGIDSEAHNQCIEMGGKTIAVLGSGLNYLTSIDNDGLYTKILESGGLVISEFEPDFKATVWSFPMRNKVVAGLATVGVLVIEAGMKSGSLITARLGKELNKPVFAVPGPISSSASEGTNWLIKSGNAKMVTEAGDIIGVSTIQEGLFEIDLKGMENDIFDILKREPLTVDEIARKLNMAISDVSVQISRMSMNNIVIEEMGKVYLARF